MFEKKNFFEGSNPKVIFLLGLFIGIAVISVIALFVVLASGGAVKQNKLAAGGVLGKAEVNTVKQPSLDQKPQAPIGNLPKITGSDHIRGSQNAPVTIVEYSDFQCPFCKRFHPTLLKIMDEYKGKIRWVYRHFPLSFHKNAQKSAEASECAGEQGKFWEYADVLFKNSQADGTNLDTVDLKKYAKNLGLDSGKFDSCLSSGKYAGKIKQQAAGGSSAGVKGTPATFINGELVSGAQPYEAVKAIIDKNL